MSHVVLIGSAASRRQSRFDREECPRVGLCFGIQGEGGCRRPHWRKRG